MKSYVIIEDVDKNIDYSQNYVSLPRSYGSAEYYSRTDIIAIKNAVFNALNTLIQKSNMQDKLKDKPIFIKPNLVSVYHDIGFDELDYPESTDPRVFDAVIEYFKQYSSNITIVESSGKPMPTPVAFKAAGYDKIAKHHNAGLVALELCEVDRYYLPKAEVMKEVYLPAILRPLINGDGIYVSVPKMKTNLYTKVTLGAKNSMGMIPYFLRERNHNHSIDQKLADLLYIINPDITIIDGIIGGEGNTPAPVDPVAVGKIIVSDNSVECDKTATAIMGFDPKSIKLICEMEKRGFGEKNTEIIGDQSVTHFRPAMPSFMDDKTKRDFPNLLALSGHTINNAPKITDINSVTPEIALALEQACTGGCLSASKTGLEYFRYVSKIKRSFHLCVIGGEGIPVNGTRYWFDRYGKPYSYDDISKLSMKKYAMGNCANTVKSIVDYYADGCCDPSKCMNKICVAAGTRLPIITPQNKTTFGILSGILNTVFTRRKFIRQGKFVDCPRMHKNEIYPIPQLSSADSEKDFIAAPLPPMSPAEKKAELKSQWQIIISGL